MQEDGKFLWVVFEEYIDGMGDFLGICADEDDADSFIKQHKNKNDLRWVKVPFYTRFTGVCTK